MGDGRALALEGRERALGAARLDDPAHVLRALELRDGARAQPSSEHEVAALLGRARKVLRA